jgi:cytidine deaminase
MGGRVQLTGVGSDLVMEDAALVRRAQSVVAPRRLSPFAEAGSVGSALVTARGDVYVGVCIDTSSGMGFCAEHAAIAAMVTQGESRIVTIVAVDSTGRILPPCGRCREFIFQMDPANAQTRVLLAGGRVVSIATLLPEHWAAGDGGSA